jgi:membrane protease YdiL (CAAX protease family)
MKQQKIFIGPYGLRAGWRFLLFAMIVGILLTVLSLSLGLATPIIGNYAANLLGNWCGVAATLAAMWIMSRIEEKPVWNYGFAAPNRGRNLASGAVAGFVALSTLMGLLTVTGAFHPGPPVLHGAGIARWGAYWAVFFVGVALSEESLMRSYPLFSLAQGIGFWPAAAILSVLFGAGHLGNSGEEWAGIGNAVLAGLVFSFSLKWTGSLWWAIGCHMTWDWGESFFYGVADSGNIAHHHFLSGGPAGPGWLSGGTVGPEGSVVATAILLALAATVRLTAPHWENPALERLRPVARPLAVDDAQDSGGIAVA